MGLAVGNQAAGDEGRPHMHQELAYISEKCAPSWQILRKGCQPPLSRGPPPPYLEEGAHSLPLHVNGLLVGIAHLKGGGSQEGRGGAEGSQDGRGGAEGNPRGRGVCDFMRRELRASTTVKHPPSSICNVPCLSLTCKMLAMEEVM